MPMKSKLENLKKTLLDMESVMIAFSGGVDSAFLVKFAHDVLGDKAVAVTARSPSYPAEEFKEAKKLTQKIGIEHVIINSQEMNNEDFTRNDNRRCYFCKKELFTYLLKLAEEKGIQWVADAANADDEKDYRPGLEAAEELGIRSLLREVKLSKEEIRRLSREMGLSTWNKPASACLSSRFPYGEKITSDKLKKVEVGESFLKTLGFHQLRIRHHGKLARIEVEKQDIPLFMNERIRKKTVNYLKNLGYAYVTLDLQGYRCGSLNEILD